MRILVRTASASRSRLQYGPVVPGGHQPLIGPPQFRCETLASSNCAEQEYTGHQQNHAGVDAMITTRRWAESAAAVACCSAFIVMRSWKAAVRRASSMPRCNRISVNAVSAAMRLARDRPTRYAVD